MNCKKHTLPRILVLCILAGVFVDGLLTEKVVEQEKETTETIELLPYEQTFRQEAERVGIDWCILAAIAYTESRFNPEAESYMGALGLMQLMPTTAQRFGLNDSTVFVPEESIRAGADYIVLLQHTFEFVQDSTENLHFVLAAYNAGPAHIMDARRLAKKYGGSPYRWFGETEHWLKELAKEEYYTDSVVKYGCFYADETINYVYNVLRKAKEYKLTSKQYNL